MKKLFKKWLFNLAFNNEEKRIIKEAVIYSAYKYRMHGQDEEYEQVNEVSNMLHEF